MATGNPPWAQYEHPLTALYHLACCEDEVRADDGC